MLPLQLMAAGELSTADNAVVTRADFLRAVVQTLKVPMDETPSITGISTRDISKEMLPYVEALQKKGALAVFGRDLSLSRGITRGEAAVVAVKMKGISSTSNTTVFSDVEAGSDMERAVRIVVDREWMRSLRSTVFGAKKPLTGAEGRSLLKKMSGGTTIKIHIEQPSIERGTSKTSTKKPAATTQEIPQADILRTVWQLLNKSFLYQERLDAKDAGYEAVEAIMKSLKDPYSTFMRPVDAAQFQDQLGGEVSGIGAQVEQQGDALISTAPLSGSPAEKAGLKAGDQILAVDGKSLVGLGFLEAVSKVRGKKGTKAVLRILRDGNQFDVEVIRDTIRVPEIDVSFQNAIAIVKLVQFGETTLRELRPLMAKVQAKKPHGIVLDLRNNPGGLLDASTVTVSNFLPEGSGVVRIVSKESTYTQVTSDPPVINQDVPMVVLVNKGSASASEIVAGALQDAKRATIVGEQTFGKGTVQQVIEFRDGSSMKMTIAEWMTPTGKKINGNGITPDVLVTSSGARDEQLLKAIDLLR